MNKQENPEVTEDLVVDDLLVELGCEELPPKTLQRLARSFYDGVCKGLADAGIPFGDGNGDVFFTPRRLGFRIPQVSAKQPDQVLERRGPAISASFDADGNPTQAALGFARSVACEVGDLERQKSEKGVWLFCRVEKPGKPLVEILYPVLEKALGALPVAKPMRWSDHSFSFVRPVHWLMVLHGSEILPGQLFGHQAGNQTMGHRIHSPGPHLVPTPADYESVLENAFVMVTPDARKQTIRKLAEKVGQDQGGSTRITDALLNEVSNIVEWPVAVGCRFEDEFLQVPKEALVASMEDHQKFFPVLNTDNSKLTSGFVVIANLESTNLSSVQQGFERVIRPRLADARFFWDQDKKEPLEAYIPALDKVVFQKSLGSVGDKSRRMATIVGELAEVCGVDTTLAQRAALLCKADLLSQMVGEFPELQGTMGAHYAQHYGEDETVCQAIGEHYAPRFAGDEIPQSLLGQLLSVADRMDTLVGIFAAGLKPSGNKDPFALRRAALGTVRILTEAGITLPLDQLLSISAGALNDQIQVSEECLSQIRAFMLERLRHYFMDQGFSTNVVNSVFAAPLTDLTDLKERLFALVRFVELPVADSLIAANKRISNILRKSEQNNDREIDEDKFSIDAERVLFEDVSRIKDELTPMFKVANYDAALQTLTGLDGSITKFFDQVMVMDDDPLIRNNRLALLAKLKGLFDQVADLALAT